MREVNDNVNSGVILAVANRVEARGADPTKQNLINVRKYFDALANDEQDGDQDQNGTQVSFATLFSCHVRFLVSGLWVQS